MCSGVVGSYASLHHLVDIRITARLNDGADDVHLPDSDITDLRPGWNDDFRFLLRDGIFDELGMDVMPMYPGGGCVPVQDVLP